ncbi:type I secretion C-terminal target domain-containing protein, partial [Halovibrio variabilis]|uniref:type I secretion C-terminal target domain-containing protein n=1 Tax=Halovibrio variabilis TaxID=31910 RepID=UPI0011BDD1DD
PEIAPESFGTIEDGQIINDISLESLFGADGAGDIAFDTSINDQDVTQNGEQVLFNGEALSWSLDGDVLTATTASDVDAITITLNDAEGNYDISVAEGTFYLESGEQTFAIGDLSGNNSVAWAAQTDGIDTLIVSEGTSTNTSNAGSIGYVGAGSQWIDSGTSDSTTFYFYDDVAASGALNNQADVDSALANSVVAGVNSLSIAVNTQSGAATTIDLSFTAVDGTKGTASVGIDSNGPKDPFQINIDSADVIWEGGASNLAIASVEFLAGDVDYRVGGDVSYTEITLIDVELDLPVSITDADGDMNDGNITGTITSDGQPGSVDLDYAPEALGSQASGEEDSTGISLLLSATDADGTVESFVIHSLPENGTLFNGDSVVNNRDEVTATNGEVTLTFVPDEDWSNNSNDPYEGTSFKYVAKDNEGLLSETATATIDVTPVTDKPTVELNLTPTTNWEMLAVNLFNVLNNPDGKDGNPEGFTVQAFNASDEQTDIAIRYQDESGNDLEPTGFGVGDDAQTNGDAVEIEQGEKLVVNLDSPASSLTFQIAWLRGDSESLEETGLYTIKYTDGSTSEVFSISGNDQLALNDDGRADRVSQPITLTASSGKMIEAIEFTVPDDGKSDFMVHSVSYESALTSYSVDITATPKDTDFSEDITQLIVKAPKGVELSDSKLLGTADGISTWQLLLTGTENDDYTGPTVEVDPNTGVVTVSGLTLTVPSDYEGDLTVEAIATAYDPDAASSKDGSDSETIAAPDELYVGTNEGNTHTTEGGNDVLIGDVGGRDQQFNPGKNYSIAIIADESGSMSGDRIQMVEDGLKTFVNDLSNHDGIINIGLIGFAEEASLKISVADLANNPQRLSDLLDEIGDFSANGGTNYEDAFNEAVAWFGTQPQPDEVGGHEFISYFMTDGEPTSHNDGGTGNSTDFETLQAAVEAFEALSNISEVNGIGIGNGNEVNADYLRFFDNTNNTGTGAEVFSTTSLLADFTDRYVPFVGSSYDYEVDPLDRGWEKTGDNSGSVTSINNTDWSLGDPDGYLSIRDNSGNGATVATSASFMIAGGDASASLQFDYRTDDAHSNDSFSWQLQKYNSNDWETQEPVGLSRTNGFTQVNIEGLDSGEYRIVYIVNDSGNGRHWENAELRIDNILLTEPDDVVTGPVGEPQVVNDADQLLAKLQEGNTTEGPAEQGDDVLTGGDGDDVIFGDALFTDDLTWTNGDDETIETGHGMGYEGLVQYLTWEVNSGVEPDDAQIMNYIREHAESLINPNPSQAEYDAAGSDTLIGGQGDDILIGGLGADTFKWELNDEGTEDSPATDIVMDFSSSENDKLDLSELLDGENENNINEYIFAEEEDGTTTLYISSDGNLSGKENADQVVHLEGKTFSDLGAAPNEGGSELIAKLIENGQLNIDQ